MKKLLFVLMACVLSIGLMGAAFAAFSDTEESTGNTFTAGTLDLKMGPSLAGVSDACGVLASASNMAPGVEVGPYDVYFRNVGSIAGKVRVTFDYAENDATQTGEFSDVGNPANEVSAADYAAAVIVTKAYLDGGADNKAPYWAEQCITLAGGAPNAISLGYIVNNGGGYLGYLPTIHGLKQITLQFVAGGSEVPWGPSDFHWETFSLKLADVGNAYQLDGIDITLTATLVQ